MLRGKLAFLLVGLLILISGCSKKDSNPVNPSDNPSEVLLNSGSITLNGGGFSNKTYNLSSGVAAYIAKYQATDCVMYGSSSSDSLMATVMFKSNSTGEFSWLGIQDVSSSDYYVDGAYLLLITGSGYVSFSPVSGSTKVTAFNGVGSTIEGTFSGSIKNDITGETVTVNGSFKCLRVPDDLSSN